MLIGDEAQGDGRLGNAGAGAANGRTDGCGGGRSRNEDRVELAGGRLEAKALAIPVGGVGQFLREGTARVVVVPEKSSVYQVYPSNLWRWDVIAPGGRPPDSPT